MEKYKELANLTEIKSKISNKKLEDIGSDNQVILSNKYKVNEGQSVTKDITKLDNKGIKSDDKKGIKSDDKKGIKSDDKKIVKLEEKKCETVQAISQTEEELLQILIDKQTLSLDILNNILNKQTEILNKNTEILNKNTELVGKQTDILNHLDGWDDKGETYKVDSTATTTIANIDCIARFTHGVKTYTITNDGDNDIYITHNLTGLGLMTAGDIDLTLKFHRILSGESWRVIYNRNVINTISYATLSGSSAFRLDLTW